MQNDPGGGAADDEVHHVDVTDLMARIEEDDEEESARAADDRGRHGFERDEQRPPWAAVRIGQVPLAAGTGGHVVCGSVFYDSTACK